MSRPDTSTPADKAEKLRNAAFYVKADARALLHLLSKLEKPLTNPNWDNEAKLLLRCSATLQKSLKGMQNVLSD